MKEKYVHREPLTSDVIFKAVFGQDTPESKAALIEVLNLVLDRKEDPIVDLIYLNPFSIAEAKSEKVIIMDVRVETSKGEMIDVEMQIGRLDTYINRTIFYGCKQLTKGLESGDDYVKMKKSIIVSFIKTTLFPSNIPMHSVFTLREDTVHQQLSNILELHYVELGKIDFTGKLLEELDSLEQFGAYLKCSGSANDVEFVETLVRKGEKVISMTDKVLRKISEEERLQAIRESREMAEIQILMEKTYAREQGLEEGRAEGRVEGRAEGRREVQLENALKMRELNIPMEQIAMVTGLSKEEIKAL